MQMKGWIKSAGGAGLLAVTLTTGAAYAADAFTKPTPAELSMTSLPGYPGAAAVVLYREEIDKDDLHETLHYERIKILTEEGKKYANVELKFVTTSDYGDNLGNEMMVKDIEARTIHADGTIIPFTGKPYLKVIDKGKIGKVQEKVFTMPAVEVGSIIEYRYTTSYNDAGFEAPDWYIQDELYIKAAHYVWYPTTHELQNSDGVLISTITWFPILPSNAKLNRVESPATGMSGGKQQTYSLDVKDVPPVVEEEYMPPTRSYTYSVRFNFSADRSEEEYWKEAGKKWSKRVNSFSDPNGELKSATLAIITGATTQDEKLRKIYAAVMALENTNYTRERDDKEDKAVGVGKINKVSDVLTLKRGSPQQLTELFIGMVRAAGMKAYAMLTPDRSENLFMQQWWNINQFDDMIVVVNVDGKEIVFDPGERYCPYGHLGWEHTFMPMMALRQTDDGTAFVSTPGDGYAANKTIRVANLTMDETEQIKGTVEMTFTGAPALRWRQASLRGDTESLKRNLRLNLEGILPKTLEVEVASIENLADYEKPLKVSYSVKGTLGTPTGKRLVLPADLFTASDVAMFPHEKRERAVYFHYPEAMQDALRINLPKNWTVEAVPEAGKYELPKLGHYDMTITQTPANFTTRRNFVFGDFLVPSEGYGPLHTFYSQFEAKDKESVILKPAATAAVPAGN